MTKKSLKNVKKHSDNLTFERFRLLKVYFLQL